MKLQEKIFLVIFKDSAVEAIMLDNYLSLFADGIPKQDVPSMEGEDVWNQIRIDRKLSDDKFLLPWGKYGNGRVISSEGMAFLKDGGYKRELFYRKISRLNTWICTLSFLLSLISLYFSLRT